MSTSPEDVLGRKIGFVLHAVLVALANMYLKNAPIQKIPFVQLVKLAVKADTYLYHAVASELVIRFAQSVIRVIRARIYLHLALGPKIPYVHLAEFVVRGVT